MAKLLNGSGMRCLSSMNYNYLFRPTRLLSCEYYAELGWIYIEADPTVNNLAYGTIVARRHSFSAKLGEWTEE